MSYRTKSSLSSRLLFEKLIDWVIHVDIVYQCWKSCDKAVSCKHITEGFEHHICCKSWFKRSFYCIGFYDKQNHNELMIKNSKIYVRFAASSWFRNQEVKLILFQMRQCKWPQKISDMTIQLNAHLDAFFLISSGSWWFRFRFLNRFALFKV